jgi:hypothetical protein
MLETAAVTMASRPNGLAGSIPARLPASSIGRMSELPSAEITMPVTVYECPLAACPWKGTDPPPERDEVIASEADVWRVMRDRAVAAEEVVRAHLETHSLLEWVQEVMRLRGELTATLESLDDANRKMRREAVDSSYVVAALVRKLGGSVDVSDADMAGGQGMLVREPSVHGCTLELHP